MKNIEPPESQDPAQDLQIHPEISSYLMPPVSCFLSLPAQTSETRDLGVRNDLPGTTQDTQNLLVHYNR